MFTKGDPKAGAPKGNNNREKNRLWRQALEKRLREYKPEDSTAEEYWALQEIADTVIKAAMGGDMQAVREIADRLDGKPAQSHEIQADITTRERSKTEVAARLLSLLEGARDGEESRDVH